MSHPAIICFSPTGTTLRILRAIAEGLGENDPSLIDITYPEKRGKINLPDTSDSILMGVPVYEEHVPDIVLDTLQTCEGENRPTVVAAVYGGVGFGMALYELCNIAIKQGFRVIGGAAFVAEHSFSCEAFPLAAGRPDAKDLRMAYCFGAAIRDRMETGDKGTLAPDDLPRFLPLMSRVLPKGSAAQFTYAPDADPHRCTMCSLCESNCPAGAIDSVSFAVDQHKCLRCFACVRCCPQKARFITAKKPWLMKRFFSHHDQTRREPAVFWPKDGTVI